MRCSILFLLMLLQGTAACRASVYAVSTPVHDVAVVRSYPHDPKAFTQGLVFIDGFLFESTGLEGQSTLRQVELETGQVVRTHRLAAHHFAEGLTWWRDRLIQLTWQSRIGFIYDRKTFLPQGSFSYLTEGWGIAQDGESLIMSDGSAMLRFLDPETFQAIRRIEVKDQGRPVERLNELEVVKGEILANVWLTDRIARISPRTGEVLGWIDLSGLRKALGPMASENVPNGIAYDESRGRLFVTGKRWPKLFEIQILPGSAGP